MLKLCNKRRFLNFDRDTRGVFYEVGCGLDDGLGRPKYTQGILTIDECKKLQEYLRQRIKERSQ